MQRWPTEAGLQRRAWCRGALAKLPEAGARRLAATLEGRRDATRAITGEGEADYEALTEFCERQRSTVVEVRPVRSYRTSKPLTGLDRPPGKLGLARRGGLPQCNADHQQE